MRMGEITLRSFAKHEGVDLGALSGCWLAVADWPAAPRPNFDVVIPTGLSIAEFLRQAPSDL
jgi:hypothetical protein